MRVWCNSLVQQFGTVWFAAWCLRAVHSLTASICTCVCACMDLCASVRVCVRVCLRVSARVRAARHVFAYAGMYFFHGIELALTKLFHHMLEYAFDMICFAVHVNLVLKLDTSPRLM